MKQQWQNSRQVIERVYVTGRLALETPAHFGNGDSGALTDIPLLRDSLDQTRPLLTGASIAGALRNYLREYEAGYGVNEERDGSLLAELLLGHLAGYDASVESWLMVDDALGGLPAGATPVEIRDGVAIDLTTRTAEVDERGKGYKYDIELLTAGTTFPLRFELCLPADKPQLLEALALALRGFETGRIGLGLRKRRGFGQCRVVEWRVWRYPMTMPEGVTGWLTHDEQADRGTRGTDILDLLTPGVQEAHRGEAFIIDAIFRLRDSLLIRADSGAPDAPDMVQLRSWRPEQQRSVPILSGTSLAGAVRGRAYRIAHTLKGEEIARRLIDEIFGRRIRFHKDEPSGSRLLVREAVIQSGITDRVQNRVKNDRFTGGAYPQALFSQQPVFAKAGEPTQVNLRLELRRRANVDERLFWAEIGLLLLLLKDLWTGDLPLGGESSVGRGRLQGQSATLRLNSTTWELTQVSDDGRLVFGGNGDPADLENKYLRALLQEVDT